MLHDLQYAWRLLRRSPVFTFTAILSLAIGIGGPTAIFTAANVLLLSAAEGVSDPDRLVDIVRTERDRGPGIAEISYPTLVDVRERATMLQEVYGYQLQVSAVSLRVDDAGAETAFADLVTTNFFAALGVRAAAGRLLNATDNERSDASPVVVLSHQLWARRFQSDRSIVGRVVRVNGHSVTVIGVVADEFHGPSVMAPDLWLPISLVGTVKPDVGARALQDRNMPLLLLGARLKAGVRRREASAEIAAIGAALQSDHPSTDTFKPPPGTRDIGPRGFVWSAETASPIPYGLRAVAAGFFGLLMAVVSTVLVIASANLAGVLLARGVGRRREIAVRTAVGAGRRRLVRQLLTETTLLFAVGGVAGLVVAQNVTRLLIGLLPALPVPVNLSMPIDTRVAAFALGLSFVAALCSGLAPARHASRTDVVTALKDDAQGPSDRMRLRQAFVVAQIAFSLLLVVVAGLLVRAFGDGLSTNRGFEAGSVDLAAVDLSQAGYTPITGPMFVQQMLDGVGALPGVESASVADRPPEPGGRSFGTLQVPGRPALDADGFFNWTLVGPRYFHTVQIPLLHGRDFTPADRDLDDPVVILGEKTAQRLFGPDGDATGQHVMVQSFVPSRNGTRPTPASARVVGVVGDVRFGNATPLAVYAPLAQRYTPQVTILARRRDAAPSLVTDLRRAVAALDPNLPVLRAESLAARGDGPVETQLRIATAVAASVGLIGLLLAGIGIYGVTSYTVTQRTREIGIRLSLGAKRGEVVGLVVGQGLRLVAVGSVVGLALALGAGRLLAWTRFGLRPFDPVILTSATVLFAVVGLIACAVPVSRATRINAMEALRYE